MPACTGIATAAPPSVSKAITDGSSNTAMFSETLLGSGPVSPIALAATTRVSTYEWLVPLNNIPGPGPAGWYLGLAVHAGLQGSAGPNCPLAYCHPSTATSGSPATPAPACAGTRTTTSCPPTARAARPLTIPNINPGGAGGTGLGTTSEAGGHSWTRFLRVATTPAESTSAFADGSVRFIKNQITYQTWWSLGTRNGNEALSSDAY